jgi:hypothetical protein
VKAKMPNWLILLQICWVAGFVALGFKLSILNFEIFDNLVPGTSKWKLFLLRKIPAPEQLNERGQILRRQFYRLLWIMVAYFVGGGLLFNLGKVVAQ